MKFGFYDNQLIGVDELQEITRSIVGEGIAFKNDADENGEVVTTVSELNKFYEKVFTTGVVPETDTSLKVTVNGDTITVAPGTAYFANGTFITLDTQEELTRISGKNYVYAVSDRDKGEAYIELCNEEKEDDSNSGMYYVPLAEISVDGAVTDRRMYAKSSIAAAPPENASGNYIKEIFIASNPKEGSVHSLFINVNPKDYKYLQLVSMGVWTNSSGESSVDEDFTFLRFDISDYTNKIPMVCAGYRDNVINALTTSAYSNDVLSDQYMNDDGAWICGTERARARVFIESISKKGIKLKFEIYTEYTLYVDYLDRHLNFELSLIRKDDITDETTVTVE